MGKATLPPDFNIHVDGSCLTNSTDLAMPKEREVSSETVVHNPSAEESTSKDAAAEEEQKAMEDHSNLINERISAQIHEAARRVVASIERDHYEGQADSILSAQTDTSYEGGETELSYDVDGTEMTYDGTEATYDGTEAAYESDAGVDAYEGEGESELDAHIEQALTAWEPTTSNDQDSSSHHDGDVSDDVFSEASRSQRSSINSVHDLGSSDEAFQKELSSPAVGEDAASAHSSKSVSRIPSINSQIPDEENVPTPSKVMHRPPFRTPSSVRAMQMGSPTPSIFSSPRSAKRHMPTVSRIGTPTSQYSPSKRTPTRFKAKKEQPLVLLHVTVLPLQWPYAHAMASHEIPESLEGVKENWSLLQDKLADTVRERGILLAHPQDSYEVLEERLLDALELPVLPRAQILKCGHYIGPSDLGDTSSDDETTKDSYFVPTPGADRKYCDICRKDVKLEETGEVLGKKRFNVKVFASNGLMRAGAWSMAWREMERVDVEIEPWVEMGLRPELELLSISTPVEIIQDEEDGFVDEEEGVVETGDRSLELELGEEHHSAEEAEIRRKFEEEELAHKIREEEEALQRQKLEDEEIELHRQKLEEEEAELHRQKLIEEEQLETQQRLIHEEEALRRKMVEEERMREIYGGHVHPHPSHPPAPEYHHEHQSHNQQRQRQRQHQRTPRREIDPDSLPELLLAAFKVLMRDKKNIAIGILSALVLFLALRPANAAGADIVEKRGVVMDLDDVVPKVLVAARGKEIVRNMEGVLEVPKIIAETVKEMAAEAVEIKPTIELPAAPVVTRSPPSEEVVRPVESEQAHPSVESTTEETAAVEERPSQAAPEKEGVAEVESVDSEIPVVKMEVVEPVASEEALHEQPEEELKRKEEIVPELDNVESETPISTRENEEQVASDDTLGQVKVDQDITDEKLVEETIDESTLIDPSTVSELESQKPENESSVEETLLDDTTSEKVNTPEVQQSEISGEDFEDPTTSASEESESQVVEHGNVF